MKISFNALTEVDQDTLAKIALAAAAGVAAVAGGKHIYKKYKEEKQMKKYIDDSQEHKKHPVKDAVLQDYPEVLDAIAMRSLDLKK